MFFVTDLFWCESHYRSPMCKFLKVFPSWYRRCHSRCTEKALHAAVVFRRFRIVLPAGLAHVYVPPVGIIELVKTLYITAFRASGWPSAPGRIKTYDARFTRPASTFGRKRGGALRLRSSGCFSGPVGARIELGVGWVCLPVLAIRAGGCLVQVAQTDLGGGGQHAV